MPSAAICEWPDLLQSVPGLSLHEAVATATVDMVSVALHVVCTFAAANQIICTPICILQCWGHRPSIA